MITAPLITPEALRAALDEPDLRIVDVRFDLADPDAGRRLHEVSRLPRACYLDLDRDLSDAQPPGSVGGRHPLPDRERFAAALGARGIAREHPVVVYDDKGGAIASRLWWMLRWAGHERVAVLDGGWRGWLAAGGQLEASAPSPRTPVSYEPSWRPELIASRAEVEAARADADSLLLDARGAARYRGEQEPLDLIAGHIPGAVSAPFADSLVEPGGRFRSPEALRERFAEAAAARRVITTCGSGVTACHLLLAMAASGLPEGRLYVGSWSDWSSAPDAAVETGPGRTLGASR